MKILRLLAGAIAEVLTVSTSTGAADADKVVSTDANGLIDMSLMPNGLGAETITLPATEALSAGDMVNVYDNGGTVSVRKADASGGVAKKADGFVLAAVVNGANATMYYGNRNTSKSGLSVGSLYYLSGATPGGVVSAPPATTGHIVQRVGKAYSATAMLVEIQDTVTLA